MSRELLIGQMERVAHVYEKLTQAQPGVRGPEPYEASAVLRAVNKLAEEVLTSAPYETVIRDDSIPF